MLTPNVAPTPLLHRLGRVRDGLNRERIVERIIVSVSGLVGGLVFGPLGGLFGAWIADLPFRRARGEPQVPLFSREGCVRPQVWVAGLAGGLGGWLLMIGGTLVVASFRSGDRLPGLIGLSIFLTVVLLVGQIVALFLGLDLGIIGGTLFGLLGGGLSGALISLATESPSGWIAGLIVMLVNGLVGLIRTSPHAWHWRWMWFWWRVSPGAAELEGALGQACVERLDARRVWTEPLRWLAKRREKLGPARAFVTLLEHSDWRERFVARHALVSLGGEAVALLQDISAEQTAPLWRTARWLLESIGHDTRARLSHQANRLLCPHCAVRYGEITVQATKKRSLTYYGCRNCGRSRGYREWTGPVVAVLDVRMEREQVESKGALWVNWLLRREPFDFDWVAVICAMDEEVERFVVQVENDTDPLRRPRYGKMRCRVAAGCGLAENSLRVLQSVFGEVEQG